MITFCKLPGNAESVTFIIVGRKIIFVSLINKIKNFIQQTKF